MKTVAVRLHEQGAVDTMQIETVELGSPGAGEVLLEQSTIGLNYMDIYQRSGYYPLDLPSGLGLEAAGKVLGIGSDVTDIAVGDRVVYGPVLGAYAKHRIAPAARMVKIPEGISDEVAAAVFMKGMTVEYLMCRTYPVSAGEHVLFHAASGGVGHLAGQWGRHIGARMIGVTSGKDNCDRILQHGYSEAIDRTNEDVAARVREMTDGKGVSVVFDSVGKASFDASLASLAPRGYFISFGATTGEAPAVTPSTLQHNGSLYFCRPSLADYVATREDLVHSANAVFDLVSKGVLDVSIDQTHPLKDVAQVHADLESGIKTGSTLLLP